jgi:hypothetical protein
VRIKNNNTAKVTFFEDGTGVITNGTLQQSRASKSIVHQARASNLNLHHPMTYNPIYLEFRISILQLWHSNTPSLLLIPHPHPPASAVGIIGGIGGIGIGAVLFGLGILFRCPVNNQRAPPITPPTH